MKFKGCWIDYLMNGAKMLKIDRLERLTLELAICMGFRGRAGSILGTASTDLFSFFFPFFSAAEALFPFTDFPAFFPLLSVLDADLPNLLAFFALFPADFPFPSQWESPFDSACFFSPWETSWAPLPFFSFSPSFFGAAYRNGNKNMWPVIKVDRCTMMRCKGNFYRSNSHEGNCNE